MIDRKLDIRAYLKSSIEFEKLKCLLFDDAQYQLFELIPKPVLFDDQLLTQYSKSSKNNNCWVQLTRLISYNSEFWKIDESESPTLEEQEKRFEEAMKTIRDKKELNVIDERLIRIIANFQGDDYEGSSHKGH